MQPMEALYANQKGAFSHYLELKDVDLHLQNFFKRLFCGALLFFS